MAIVSVLKYEGDNSTFIWKHPKKDFNTGTELIVHESQEAIFMLNGEVLDIFGPGRHMLETENLPIIRRVMKFATGGRNALGMISGVGGEISKTVSGVTSQAMQNVTGMMAQAQPSPVSAPQAPQMQARFCMNCGQELMAEAKFCPMCGTKRG